MNPNVDVEEASMDLAVQALWVRIREEFSSSVEGDW